MFIQYQPFIELFKSNGEPKNSITVLHLLFKKKNMSFSFLSWLAQQSRNTLFWRSHFHQVKFLFKN
jgi:hypothetical protein